MKKIFWLARKTSVPLRPTPRAPMRPLDLSELRMISGGPAIKNTGAT